MVMVSLMNEFFVDKLQIKTYESRLSMGIAAAADVAAEVKALLSSQEEISMIFAAAPSQLEMLEALCNHTELSWNKVNAFHMDEYIGLPDNAPQSFGRFLNQWIFSKLPFKSVHYLNGSCPDYKAECTRYSALLQKFPADVVCLGIGENGHVAFNDPPIADFDDPFLVKQVILDSVCREQQVHDGCFARLEDVPKQALTLTIPALMRGGSLFCVVPAATKANAVRTMLTGEIEECCPASILRTHDHARLYLDSDSSSLL
jgi:glucosamine-6-phosphate deaminase